MDEAALSALTTAVAKNALWVCAIVFALNIFSPLMVEWLKRVFFNGSVGRREYDGKTQLIYLDNETMEKFLGLYTRHIEILEKNTAGIVEANSEIKNIKEVADKNAESMNSLKIHTAQIHKKVVMGN